MKNKLYYILIIVIAILLFNNNVYAASVTVAKEGSSNYSNFASSFNSGIPSFTVSQALQEIVVYGKSVCSASGCSYQYQGVGSPSIRDLLKSAVRCSGGENNIEFVLAASAGEDYKQASNTSENGTIYWQEAYSVRCVSSSTGRDNVITLDSTSGSSSGIQSGTSSGTQSGTLSGTQSGTSSGSSTDSQYSSSTSTSSPNTGVETYYIVLGIVAIVSYVFMIFAKKYNLFKNI